jgi:hypothetical protein
MLQDGIDSVIGKRDLFLLQKLKEGMSGDARDFNNIETRAVIKFPTPPPPPCKEVHAILTETLGEHVP